MSIDVDPGRRALVLGGAALAGLGASGCCSFIPTPQIPGPCVERPAPFLAGPEVLAAWSRPERYFDAHTHFFNARDVPVAGFLAKSVAHSAEPESVRELLIAIAPIAERLAQLAPTPAAEHNDLCRGQGLRALSLTERSGELDKEIDSRRDEVARELHREILRQSSEIPRLFNQAESAAQSRNPSFLRGRATNFSEELIRDALRDGGSPRDPASGRLAPLRGAQLPAEAAEAMSLRGVMQFVGLMLSPRHHNARTFIRRFAEDSPNLPLSGCFAAMVDFNYWLDCPAKASNMEDQVRLHAQLSLLSRGFIMPLVPYNPWVDILESDASLKLVKKAVEGQGCVGVKIYPPMGFYPYNNRDLPLKTEEPRPDPALLDKKLAALYELCDSLGVPVMAHANESNGRDSAHDKLAGSIGWAELRKKTPALRRLYVNAGHFGGALRNASGDWTDDFVNLMRAEGPLRVFGDLGYWSELPDNPAVAQKLARVLAAPIGSGATAGDRAMYGSDWHMLSREPGWQTYGNGVAAVIKRLDATGALAPKVLGGNALQCFGLTEGSGRGCLERLVDFHTSQGSGPPGWLKGRSPA